jgi:uncharacterized membrane protein/thiol-disulfide isomerase/thioredoxin
MASSTLTRSASPARGRRGRARRAVAPAPIRDPFVIAAALVGLLVSAYLAVVDLAGGSTLCLAGSDCDAVRASAFGRVAGLPVAVLGAVYFVTVLLAAVGRGRWQPRVLQTLGGVGLGAALVFVGLQGLVLRAWCPYCLVADAAALAIGGLTLWPRPGRSGGLARGIVGAALAVVVLVAGFALNSPAVTGAATATTAAGAAAGAGDAFSSPDQLAALADYLRQSGAVFYGASWCPHCQAQKQMFGAAASKLPYVECDPRGTDAQPDVCQAVGVQAYPTWVINGQKHEGEISPSELAQLSGFGG